MGLIHKMSYKKEIQSVWPLVLVQTERWHHTKERDGVAQLTSPLSPGLCVQLIQTLHDVPIAHFTVPDVALQAGAPEAGRHVKPEL